MQLPPIIRIAVADILEASVRWGDRGIDYRREWLHGRLITDGRVSVPLADYERLHARWATGAPTLEPRPNWRGMAASLARTLGGWALGGFGWLTGQALAQRQGACLACPHYLPERVARCGLCGCLLRAKQRLPQATCPAGKWRVD